MEQGWRWNDDGKELSWTKEAEEMDLEEELLLKQGMEESGADNQLEARKVELRRKKTTEEMRKMFCRVLSDFEFTTELETDFPGGFIPTLDTRLKLCKDGSVSYSFYEKEVASRFCIMEGAALAENSKTSSLAQEVVRRMMTTQEWACNLPRKRSCIADTVIGKGEVCRILEEFNQKLTRSGYDITRRREIIKAGLLGYKRRVSRIMKETGGFRHKIGAESMADRKLAKMIEKTSWFKKKGNGDMRLHEENHRGHKNVKGQPSSQIPLAVLFVQRTA